MYTEKYGLNFYEYQENIIDTGIFTEKDELTFSVLISIVNNKSSKVFTDGKTVIICYSCAPFPVWVWTSEDVTAGQVCKAAKCLKEEFPATKGFSYNLSYGLLELLCKENAEFRKLTIKTNMLTYYCDTILDLERPCNGKVRLAAEDDMDLLSRWQYNLFYDTKNNTNISIEECQRQVIEKIATDSLFVWVNKEEEIVSMAAVWPEGRYSKVTMVYTPEKERRKGYALHLVHWITEEIQKKDMLPILYTDADYEASNRCYKKIGYVQAGSLCCIK